VRKEDERVRRESGERNKGRGWCSYAKRKYYVEPLGQPWVVPRHPSSISGFSSCVGCQTLTSVSSSLRTLGQQPSSPSTLFTLFQKPPQQSSPRSSSLLQIPLLYQPASRRHCASEAVTSPPRDTVVDHSQGGKKQATQERPRGQLRTTYITAFPSTAVRCALNANLRACAFFFFPRLVHQ
jgi:hypothetical protein